MARRVVSFVNRPNKDFVRTELVRLIGRHTQASAEPENYSYVSLAGYRFLDSIEVYKTYRIRSLYCIEDDELTHRRADFNRPYEWLNLFYGRLPSFLEKHGADIRNKSKILFLDYTDPLSHGIIEELDELFLSDFFTENGLLFLTFNAHHDPPTPYVRETADRRFPRLRDYLEWLETHVPSVVRTILRAHFAGKDIRELAKFLYQDTWPMAAFAFRVDNEDAFEEEYETVTTEWISVPDITAIEGHKLRRFSSQEPEELSEETGVPVKDIRFFLKHD